MPRLKKIFPRNLLAILPKPSAEIVCLLVRMKKGAVDAVYDVLDVIRGYQIPCEGFRLDLYSNVFEATCFLNVKGKIDLFNNMLWKLQKVEGVDEVLYEKLYEKFPGFAVDVFHYPLLVLSERVLFLSVSSFGEILKWLWKSFGTGAAAIIYNLGVSMGRQLVSSFKKHTKMTVIEAVELFTVLARAGGWGIFEGVHLDLETPSLVFRVYDNWEAPQVQDLLPSRMPACLLTKGFIVGVASAFFEVALTANETRCIALGDDFCEFHLAPESE